MAKESYIRDVLVFQVSEGAIAHIYAKNFSNLLINLPPLEYQNKIVSILVDSVSITVGIMDQFLPQTISQLQQEISEKEK